MTRDQASIAVPILNSYAHTYLGLPLDRVLVAAGNGPSGWVLIVAIDGDVSSVTDLDDAKKMIDGAFP